MNNLQSALKKGRGFLPFLTCGDPDLETTAGLLRALEQSGALGAELGIPFSDATAEGPCRQNAALRALKKGVTADGVLDMIEAVRQDVTMPLILVTYANVVYSYGVERFVRRAKEAGADGLLLTDVPYEEREEFSAPCEAWGLEWITSIAPAPRQRMEEIARNTKGIVSCCGRLQAASGRIVSSFSEMRAILQRENPGLLCLAQWNGASLDGAEQAASSADGMVISDAFAALSAQYGEGACAHLSELTEKLKKACEKQPICA